MLTVTEERKRISSVASYLAPHINIDQAVIQLDPPIADQLMTTPPAAASMGGRRGRRNFGLLTEGSSA